MPTIEPIRITGLKELQAALKRMDGESQKKLRLVQNEAADIIVQSAKRKVPRKSGKAAASIKAQSSQREGKVIAGGRKAPYYAWLDFGGSAGPYKSIKRPYRQGGRYLYPSFGENRAEIMEALARGLKQLIEESGLEVKQG